MRSKFAVFVTFVVISATTFRLLLLSPSFLDLFLHQERSLHDDVAARTRFSNFAASPLPWSSARDLQTQHGEGSDLGGKQVRNLYKNVLIEGKLNDWVEAELSQSATRQGAKQEHREQHPDEYVAASCAKMRWQARLYSRSRHQLHPISSEYLGIRDAWVHGVQKGSWRNFVACIAQNEEYPCPGIVDEKIAAATAAAAEETSNRNLKAHRWISKTIGSCRKSNDYYNEILGENDETTKQMNEDL